MGAGIVLEAFDDAIGAFTALTVVGIGIAAEWFAVDEGRRFGLRNEPWPVGFFTPVMFSLGGFLAVGGLGAFAGLPPLVSFVRSKTRPAGLKPIQSETSCQHETSDESHS